MARGRSNRRRADFESLWLLTFADLMVQLMAFFALLYAFSAQDQDKVQEVIQGLQKALGVKQAQAGGPQDVPGGTGILPGGTGIDPKQASNLEALLSGLEAQQGPDVGSRLRVVTFRGSILFGEGSPAFTPGSDLLLAKTAEVIQKYPGFEVVVEGHAAPKEHGRAGADALELSGQRAQAVARFLAAHGVAAERVAAEAHGDSRPDGDAGSPEGRALQRRVVFRFQRPTER